MIRTKRVYEPAARTDGKRFLVDRLWPRGVKKEGLQLAGWTKEAAPSDGLRRWFNHDPAKWAEFRRRYRAELAARPENWQPLLEAAKTGDITLLFGAHDVERNNAVVLKACLDDRLKKGKGVGPA
jgi:uncharacterized protein YeaO (DUF488 family)